MNEGEVVFLHISETAIAFRMNSCSFVLCFLNVSVFYVNKKVIFFLFSFSLWTFAFSFRIEKKNSCLECNASKTYRHPTIF